MHAHIANSLLKLSNSSSSSLNSPSCFYFDAPHAATFNMESPFFICNSSQEFQPRPAPARATTCRGCTNSITEHVMGLVDFRDYEPQVRKSSKTIARCEHHRVIRKTFLTTKVLLRLRTARRTAASSSARETFRNFNYNNREYSGNHCVSKGSLAILTTYHC